MDRIRLLNVASQLKGMPVLLSGVGLKPGQVADAIVHPTDGSLIGLVIVSPEGRERSLMADDFFIFAAKGAVIVVKDALQDIYRINAALSEGIRVCRDLIGSQVITKTGKYLGRVIEVYVKEDDLQAIHRVATSKLQRIFGGGFFITGEPPYAWSKMGARLIVNGDSVEREGFASLEEAVRFTDCGPAYAGRGK